LTDEFINEYGIRDIINASGTMTSLGSTLVNSKAIQDMEAIMGKWVEMDLLQKRASQLITEVTGAEAGFVTACAAAGITLSLAGCITGKDFGKIRRLPDTTNIFKDEVIIQKGHLINYGANIRNTVELSGSNLIEFGSVSGTSVEEMKGAINERTAAALFVVSHHTTQYGNISFEKFLDEASQKGIPVVVDAAAEYKFADFIKKGADIVICSGHKFLQGPTSGLVSGKKELIDFAYMQNYGIGRGMKVGKEGIIGLMAALKNWQNRDIEKELDEISKKADLILNILQDIDDITLKKVKDPTGNPIIRVQIEVHEKSNLNPTFITSALKKGTPPIYTRDYHTEEGYFQLDLRFINKSEINIICDRIKEIILNNRSSKDNDWVQETYMDYKQDKFLGN